jgi:argininosuccinate synthase
MTSCTNSSKSYNSNYIEDNYYNSVEGIDYVILPYDPIKFEWITLAFEEGIPVELTIDEIKKLIMMFSVNGYA